MSYKVKIDVFEGPFDLLVYLIEHAEMSIYDIKIADITDQYLAHMSNIKNLNVELAGEFMVLAATLIEIKSKMLLPRYSPDAMTGAIEDDPRAELVERILEYKKFKIASELLEKNEEYALLSLTKPQEDLSEYIKTDEEYLNLDIDQFVKAFNMFLVKKKKIEEVHRRYGEIERERISIEDKVTHIRRLLDRGFMDFEAIVDDWEDKAEIVAAFMAVLELIRRREIIVRQHVTFGNISIEKQSIPQGVGPVVEGGEEFVV